MLDSQLLRKAGTLLAFETFLAFKIFFFLKLTNPQWHPECLEERVGDNCVVVYVTNNLLLGLCTELASFS